MLNRSSIPRTTSSTPSLAEHLHLPIRLLVTMGTLEVRLTTPARRMEASTLIAGRIASRARILPHLNHTIGDRAQVLLPYSSHRTHATTHPLRLRPSTLPPVRVLVAGKTARDQSLAVKMVPTPHSHQDPPRRGRATTRPDLHLQPINDPTIDTLPPHPQRRPLSLGQTALPHPLRITPILRHPRLRPRDPSNLHPYLRATIPWQRNAYHAMTAISVKPTIPLLVVLEVVSKVASGALCLLILSRKKRQRQNPRGRHLRPEGKHLSNLRRSTLRIPLPRPSQRSLANHCSTRS